MPLAVHSSILLWVALPSKNWLKSQYSEPNTCLLQPLKSSSHCFFFLHQVLLVTSHFKRGPAHCKQVLKSVHSSWRIFALLVAGLICKNYKVTTQHNFFHSYTINVKFPFNLVSNFFRINSNVESLGLWKRSLMYN